MRPRTKNRGTILATVLICLTIAGVIAGVLVRQLFIERKAIDTFAAEQQAVWLVEAGLERAVARLAADTDYQGETWAVTAEELASRDSGEVRIHVEQSDSQPMMRVIGVEADYPQAIECRNRRTKQILVNLEHLGAQPAKATP